MGNGWRLDGACGKRNQVWLGLGDLMTWGMRRGYCVMCLNNAGILTTAMDELDVISIRGEA